MIAPGLPDELRAVLPASVQAYIGALEAAVALLPTLQAEVAALGVQVAELQARLNQDSSNSSRPPSSDPPGAEAKRPRAALGEPRPAGGQVGHPGRTRALKPPEQIDRRVAVVPERCGQCGDPLVAEAGLTDPADERVQVTDLPPVLAEVTEYRLAARRCGGCGHLTRAARPAEAGGGSFGPRLQAVAAVLTGRYRLSRREAEQCLAELWGADVALGSVAALEQATSAALAPIVDAARAAVRQAPVANLDETGWRQGRRRAWLWTAVTEALTVFRIDPSRAGAVARELLGPAWDGVVGSDRFSAYAWLPVGRRQICWAHLKRDFCGLTTYHGPAAEIGERLLAIEAHVFALWHRFTRGEIDRSTLRRELAPIQADCRRVLRDGTVCRSTKAATLANALLGLWPALWTFAEVDRVEPTNNAAERALRPAVLWRKGSFGTHSPDGSRFAERMLTVVASCRQQGRRLLDFLVQATTAARLGLPPPSLLPVT